MSLTAIQAMCILTTVAAPNRFRPLLSPFAVPKTQHSTHTLL
ncbi:hypothetical protein ANO14919_098160 [Xylariales sp. No.14919]|nr:hypothetical protein ANO14919_098160 [Xylariales sp. No.14919]